MTITDTAPPREQLGATALNRRWFYEVADPDAAGYDPTDLESITWVPIRGITEAKVDPGTGSTVEVSDFDGEGYNNSEMTSLAWGASCKIRRGKKPGTGTATVEAEYDPGQEIVRRVSRQIGHELPLRVSEIQSRMMPRKEAYRGMVIAVWAEDGGDVKAVSTVAITFTGKGKPEDIEHPYPIRRSA